ncbi:MAG: hypothetical protein IT195_13295 [Microthrixaceae bacterium]|nr:hypothetical protein [Microthrixaceae bacterium]
MVGVDVDGVDQVFDEHPSLLLVGFVPDGVDIDAGEEFGDLLESLGEFAAGLGLFGVFVMGGLEGADQGGEASFLLLEGVRGDLVLVVQVEEPLT